MAAAYPRHLGAEIGVVAVLHTWGQNLHHHPHVHCVMPRGGLSLEPATAKAGDQRWIACRPGFFLPVRVSVALRFGAVDSDGPGMPPLPTRLMAGLATLKHTFNLSDEVLCERWVENPYFQYLCGEEFVRHALPFDRSSIDALAQPHGRGADRRVLQESLSIAVKTGAMKPTDTRQVIVDTTVQPKNVMFPTDAKLIHRARERLVRLAKQAGLDLRQTYVRVGKLALIKHQRYAHAKQFKRASKALRRLKTYLGRTIRDISRQIAGDAELGALFKRSLYQASTVLEQRQRQRGRKIYSLHAHEVECIGEGAQAPYEFGGRCRWPPR